MRTIRTHKSHSYIINNEARAGDNRRYERNNKQTSATSQNGIRPGNESVRLFPDRNSTGHLSRARERKRTRIDIEQSRDYKTSNYFREVDVPLEGRAFAEQWVVRLFSKMVWNSFRIRSVVFRKRFELCADFRVGLVWAYVSLLWSIFVGCDVRVEFWWLGAWWSWSGNCDVFVIVGVFCSCRCGVGC